MRKRNKNLSPAEFYGYHMMKRNTASDYLLNGGRLYQELILFAWTTAEDQRLNIICSHQDNLRADSYSNVRAELARREHDHLYTNDHNPIGRVVLSPSYTGSPRYYQEKFLNSTTIVARYGKPDLFITMTCNPNWPEIKNQLKPEQKPQDWPDLVAFHMFIFSSF